MLRAAVQEERFSRLKHDATFPEQSIRWILETRKIDLASVDCVVFYEKPFVRFERLLYTYLGFAPSGLRSFCESMPRWAREKLFQRKRLLRALRGLPGGERWNGKLWFSEHHLSHAASAFYPSPFEEAAILTVDGVGEWTTTQIAVGEGAMIRPLKEMSFPHSLGLLYSALTAFIGFKVNSGEYKVMGLAPYGEPRFAERMERELIDLRADGSFRLNMAYFRFATDLKMTGSAMATLLGTKPRHPEAPLDQVYIDIAASLQQLTEKVMLGLAHAAARETGKRYLCLAGGVALNCVANGKLLRDGCFEDIWVQPAAGDAGAAAGAAWAAYHMGMGVSRVSGIAFHGTFLGPAFDDEVVVRTLASLGACFEELDDEMLLTRCAEDLAAGKVLGWMQGAAEFGPRALGNRSILADPRPSQAQRDLNLKIKFRESFRPFAPAVLVERAKRYFSLDRESPYMAFVSPVLAEAQAGVAVPAVTHVDGSARVQTVAKKDNPRFHALLSRFEALTGCPMLVNTSFNVRGEPMILTPEHAYACFMGTGMDRLVIGNCYLTKEGQRGGSPYEKHASLFAAD